jgi:hypothetical protein
VGKWAIRFYDHSGEDWITEPIKAGADCASVIAALENLPNNVIPAGETLCTKTTKANTADNAWIGEEADADYKITYRMSVWDAYVYKKFGTSYNDVLSLKSNLGNQVYSPLLWLPGSMTMPFDADTYTTKSLTAKIDILDAALGSSGAAPASADLAAQAAGAGSFFVSDSSGVTALEQGEMGDGDIIVVTAVPGKHCRASGYYTIRGAQTFTATDPVITVNEAVPAILSGEHCQIDIDNVHDMGSGQTIQGKFAAPLVLANVAGGTGLDWTATVDATTATTSSFDLASALATTNADYQKIRPGVLLEISDTTGNTCEAKGIYTVRSFGGTTVGIWESIAAETDGTHCEVDIYQGNLPAAATRLTMTGDIYRIKFLGNPGKLQQPEIVTHLDGKRNSLMSTEYDTSAAFDGEPNVNNVVITKVFTDGQQGEDKDYFADHCDGVTVTIDIENAMPDPAASIGTAYSAGQAYYDGNIANNATWHLVMDATEANLLKTCLGDADLTTTNNVDINNWDYGNDEYPHLIKLVRTVTSYTDGGYYVAIYWDAATAKFQMLNPFTPPDALETDVYEVYTTKGTLARVSEKAQAYFGFGQKKVITTHTNRYGAEAGWDGDISCEVGDNNGFRLLSDATSKDDASVPFIADLVTTAEGINVDTTTTSYKNCVNKTDIITFLNFNKPALNAPHMNLYTVDRLVKDKVSMSKSVRYGTRTNTAAGSGGGVDTGNAAVDGSDPILTTEVDQDMQFGTNVISLDLSTNWAVELYQGAADHYKDMSPVDTRNPFYVYKFIPHVDSTYDYVAECSNRGLCDYETGVCECFTGYTDDACNSQDSLSL